MTDLLKGLEALAKDLSQGFLHGYAARIRVLLAEAREEGKPLEKSEGQKATEWSQRPTREWEPAPNRESPFQ